MAMRRQLTGMLLVSAVSLGLAAPALAAPADEEYLPKVPKAAGDEVVAGEGKGSTILSPKARGAEEGDDETRTGAMRRPWPEARTMTRARRIRSSTRSCCS